jgi:Domain of unknown function (DUF4082)
MRLAQWAGVLAGVLLVLSGPARAQSFKQYALTDYVNQMSGTLTLNDQTTSPGSVLVVACTYNPTYGRCTAPPTDTEGNSFVLASSKEAASGTAGQKIYYAVNITGGTNDTITCYSDPITSVSCIGVEIAGVNALDQGSDSTQATGSGLSPASPTVITTQPNEILLGFGAIDPGSSSTFSAYGTGWTGIVRGSAEAEYQSASSTGGYTATGSVSSAEAWVMGVVAFYQAPPIALNPQTVASGFPSIGTVGLAAPAPPGGATVMLSSSNPSVATVPASILIPAGMFSAHFLVNTNPASPSATVSISATYNSVTNTAPLAVEPVNSSIRYSIWSTSATPTISDDGGTSPVEVGVKFTSDSNGFISGIRFYKSAANTGTHVGNLWSSTGQLLATGIFTGETASGWQEMSFDSPVAINADTIYVASYHTNAGHTADDHSYFTNIGVDNLLLHAPTSSASGGNGVFALGSGGIFPQTTNQDSNYWVDVVFLEGAPAPAPRLLSLVLNPAKTKGGLDSTGTVTLTAAAPTGGATVSLASGNPGVAAVPSTVTVPAGMTKKTFLVTTSVVKYLEAVDISASFGPDIKHALLTLTPCFEYDQHKFFGSKPCLGGEHEDHDHRFDGHKDNGHHNDGDHDHDDHSKGSSGHHDDDGGHRFDKPSGHDEHDDQKDRDDHHSPVKKPVKTKDLTRGPSPAA